MHSRTRFVIAFVLALVVPWHAAAAVTMVGCDPAPAHEHHAMADQVTGAEHATHHEHHDGAASAKVKCQTSSSACCASAALPSTATALDASVASQRFAPAVSIGVAPFLTAGLERPPRTDRA